MLWLGIGLGICALVALWLLSVFARPDPDAGQTLYVPTKATPEEITQVTASVMRITKG